MEQVLEPREREVLVKRFGLRGYRNYTLNELAEELEVSRERVRQIQRRAIRKLRAPLVRLKLHPYIS
jgi:RNA polymerase sigma factor (sigma-70 family)